MLPCAKNMNLSCFKDLDHVHVGHLMSLYTLYEQDWHHIDLIIGHEDITLLST